MPHRWLLSPVGFSGGSGKDSAANVPTDSADLPGNDSARSCDDNEGPKPPSELVPTGVTCSLPFPSLEHKKKKEKKVSNDL